MAQPTFLTRFTPTYRQSAYPAISPLLPELSCSGKTILVTAGATGLGFFISRGFCQAQASNVILLSRRESVLSAASEKLSSEFPNTNIHTYVCDITDAEAVAKVFSSVKGKIGRVDILVNSATNQSLPFPITELTPAKLKETFDTLVLGPTNLLNAFIASSPPDPSNEKVFIGLSSIAAHCANPTLHAYGAAKAAFTIMLQHYNDELSGKGLRVHSIHPGAVLTPAARAYGATEEMMDWEDGGLTGGFVVWLSSTKGEFLRGKFVWANWDVEELEARKEEIASDPDILRLGLVTGKLELFPVDGAGK